MAYTSCYYDINNQYPTEKNTVTIGRWPTSRSAIRNVVKGETQLTQNCLPQNVFVVIC